MKTIIIIDDELTLLDAYSLMLKKRGYRVLTAANAFQGIELILQEDVDLIITDINMPKKDGLIMIKQLKRILKCRNIPIIILSGSGTKENVFRGIEMGVASFFTKPVEFETLLKTIKKSLKQGGKQPVKKNKGAAVKESYNDISLLLTSENIRISDHFYQYLTEKFPRVYVEAHVRGVEKILMKKHIDALVIEAELPLSDSIKHLFRTVTGGRYIGMPVVVISQDSQKIRSLLRGMGIKVDLILSKPFVYEKFTDLIYTMMNRENMQKKIDMSIEKIRKAIKRNAAQKTQLIYDLKKKVAAIKKENFKLIREWKNTNNDEEKYAIIQNHHAITEIMKEIAAIKKNYLKEKAELLEAERVAQHRLSHLNKVS